MVIGKIARLDYPNEWPNLFDALIRAGDLACLHRVVKVLSTKTLLSSRLAFQAIAPNLLAYIVSTCVSFSIIKLTFFKDIYQRESIEGGDGARAIKCLQTIRRLLAHGFKQLHIHPDNCALLKLLVENMGKRLGNMDEANQRYMLKTGKIFVELVSSRPLEFVQMDFISVAQMYWRIIEGSFVTEKIAIQGLVILKNLMKHPGKCRVLTPTNIFTLDFTQINNQKYDTREIRQIVDSQLYTAEFCAYMLTSLVPRLLVIDSTDLSTWAEV